eukprot:gene346-499_t
MRQEVGLVGRDGKIGIAEIVAARVDVQAAIGAGQAVVVPIAPHAADVGALFVDVEAQRLVMQRLGDGDSRGAGADDADVRRLFGHAADVLSCTGAPSNFFARDAGVTRFVMTSSMAAIAYGDRSKQRFTEADWTNAESPDAYPYVRSKTIAERAARDWIAAEGGAMEYCTVNPAAVLGPVWSDDFSASIEVVKKMLEGALPGYPRFGFGIVDVRDVADLHVRALNAPGLTGERCSIGPQDDLSHHHAIHRSGWAGRVVTTYRPDGVIDVEHEAFKPAMARFAELTGEDVYDWTGYLAAHRKRRADFRAAGATATDHGSKALGSSPSGDQAPPRFRK